MAGEEGGFGGGPFGGAPWGGASVGSPTAQHVSDFAIISEALVVEVPFEVTSAESLSLYLVKVDFTGFVDPGHAANFLATNYTIPGLTVLGAAPFSGKSVILQTTPQSLITYTVTVNAASVQGYGGDPLDALNNSAMFLGTAPSETFTATAQSRRKVVLTFSEEITVDAAFANPANYRLQNIDGTFVTVTSVSQTGPDDTRAILALGEDLEPLDYYSVQILPPVLTVSGRSFQPDIVLFQWKEHIPVPIRIQISNFSGEVSGGLLGTPAGLTFFSPAFETAVPDSVLSIDSVSVCTRAFDVYTIPSLPDPQPLFTYPAPSTGATSLLGPGGGVLIASAHRLGLAQFSYVDAREDTYTPPVDGPADATLEEPIDITRASFLNDDRWRTFPGTGASLGSFILADNQTFIGPGPTVNINLQP